MPTVSVTLKDIDGRLVTCAVIVTVPPLGTAVGALYVVTMPVIGYNGTGPEVVCVGLKVPHAVSIDGLPTGAALPQVTVQVAPSNSLSFEMFAYIYAAGAPPVNLGSNADVHKGVLEERSEVEAVVHRIFVPRESEVKVIEAICGLVEPPHPASGTTNRANAERSKVHDELRFRNTLERIAVIIKKVAPVKLIPKNADWPTE